MPMQLEVFGFVHHTHPASAELREDAIVRNGLAGHSACVAVRRRTSSKKFSRKMTWFCTFFPSGVSTGINAAMRLPSDARSMFLAALATPPSCFSDHLRGLSATKESPFTAYAATMMWLSKASKKSSCPLRDHIGYVPSLFEI